MIASPAVFGVLAGLVAAACTVPYVRDTLRGETVPHRGSWLIWSVLEVVALEAQRADGATWSLIPLMIQALGTCLVWTLSLWFGSGGLGRVEFALLALAGLGIVGWLVIQRPVVATACAIAADLVGAIMMAPKAWRDPHSETLSTFVLASASGVLMVGSVGSLSTALLMYPVYFVVVNAVLAGVILHGRAAVGSTSSGARPTIGRAFDRSVTAASRARDALAPHA
jgi:hypothetical protein